MIVYKVTNLINGKFYIGLTQHSAEERLNSHWREAKSHKKNNKPLTYYHNALLYYGIENFKIEVIDTAENREELNKKEIYWINKLDATNREIAYNRQLGGKSGQRDEFTKKIIGQKKKENWQNPEIAEKMREGLTKATQAWQQKCLDNRIEFECPYCHKKIMLPPWEAKNRKYCSSSCAAKANSEKRVTASVKSRQDKIKERNKLFINDIDNWIINNKEIIINCPKNKISTNLQDILQIAKKYELSDWRTISKTICGKDSRKELLSYLQQKCENVR